MTRLRLENVLQLIAPSDTLTNSYIMKSESNLNSAKILLNNDKLEESVSLAYYSMYHIVTALLFKAGIKCENHKASIFLLKELFDVDNNNISFAKTERIDKQYYTDFKLAKKDVIEAINVAEEFNKEIFDLISKINSVKIKEYRERFMYLV